MFLFFNFIIIPILRSEIFTCRIFCFVCPSSKEPLSSVKLKGLHFLSSSVPEDIDLSLRTPTDRERRGGLCRLSSLLTSTLLQVNKEGERSRTGVSFRPQEEKVDKRPSSVWDIETSGRPSSIGRHKEKTQEWRRRDCPQPFSLLGGFTITRKTRKCSTKVFRCEDLLHKIHYRNLFSLFWGSGRGDTRNLDQKRRYCRV